MDWINRYTAPLLFKGVAYAPGEIIPDSVDPAQLAYFAAQGIVEPTTAPAPVPTLRRVSSQKAVSPTPVEAPVKEAEPHGDERAH